MHLVIASRIDPFLPVSRLRVRGQMVELRADDLRFTPQEAAEFLNQAMGLGLSGDDVTGLDARTEGWIAGLQLADLITSYTATLRAYVARRRGELERAVKLSQQALQTLPVDHTGEARRLHGIIAVNLGIV